jgi:hypothetical protein
LPFPVCTVISPGSGPAPASHINVPPVTLLAFVAPVTETAVLPTTVVVPAVTLIVVVTGPGADRLRSGRAGDQRHSHRSSQSETGPIRRT